MLKLLAFTVLLHSTCPAFAAPFAWTVRPAAPEPHALLTGFTLTMVALGPARPLGDQLRADQLRRKPLGKLSRVGDYAGQLVPNALYAGGTALAGYFGHSAGYRRAQVMIVATAEAALITTVLKYSLREYRPDGSARNSLPSGHSTTAFAFAAIVGAEHGWTAGVPAYALATFVGWSRIHDNAHFLHDVIAGATFGLSVGLGVAMANAPPSAHAWRIDPMILGDGAGLSLQAKW